MRNPCYLISELRLMTTKNALLFLFILLKFLLQYFAIDSGYELHRDEYLHLDLGKHLAWGYASVPPVTSWISLLIYHLGNTVFWVKLFPAAFGALTMVVVWKTIELLNGKLFALILSASCITLSVLLRINTLYQPNSLEFLMWTITFHFIVRFIDSDDNKWLWFAAIAFAVGFLNKYNISFLVLGLLPAIMLTRHRKIFLNKHFYLSIFLVIVLTAPNLYWQYSNDLPVFHHLKELADKQLVNVDRLDFLKEQLMFFSGSLVVIVLGFVSFFKFAPFKKFAVLFWSYIFTITIYFFLKAKGYYAIGLYPIFIAFGSVYLEHLLKQGWTFYVRPVMVLIPIITIIPLFQIILPVLPPKSIIQKHERFQKFGLLRWEDGIDHALPQDYADMLGWRELGAIVDSTFSLVSEKENTLIHCDNYGQAGAINYYSNQQYTEAVSLNADYINWYPLEDMEIQNVILVQEADDDDPDREREKMLFDEVRLIGSITNKYSREYGAKVYLLQGAKKSINDILKQEIAERKTNQ